jgi:hypothetical protein
MHEAAKLRMIEKQVRMQEFPIDAQGRLVHDPAVHSRRPSVETIRPDMDRAVRWRGADMKAKKISRGFFEKRRVVTVNLPSWPACESGRPITSAKLKEMKVDLAAKRRFKPPKRAGPTSESPPEKASSENAADPNGEPASLDPTMLAALVPSESRPKPTTEPTESQAPNQTKAKSRKEAGAGSFIQLGSSQRSPQPLAQVQEDQSLALASEPATSRGGESKRPDAASKELVDVSIVKESNSSSTAGLKPEDTESF